jgi:arginase
MASRFDLALGYPQWQGSGRHQNLPRGAAVAAKVCGRFAPLVTVPLSEVEQDGERVNRWVAILDQFRRAQAILAEHEPKRLLTAGGDCAVDVAAIDYLQRRHPDLTVIWVDAHLDANTPETSPSGNFHGMPVSAIMGYAPATMRALLQAPLDPSRFRYFGVRMSDEGDRAFQREHGLRMLGPNERIEGPVHIHFDLDVLDPTEFPWIAYPEGVLPIDDGVALVARIAREADLVGLTITEFAPADDDGVQKGTEVITRLCAAAG